MPATTALDLIEVQNVNVPGHRRNVDRKKYEAMKKALLRILPPTGGLTQAQMFDLVLPHLPAELFPGGSKSAWWAKTVQLDLEARDVIVREGSRPTRWRRA